MKSSLDYSASSKLNITTQVTDISCSKNKSLLSVGDLYRKRYGKVVIISKWNC